MYGASAAGRRAPTRFTLPAPQRSDGAPWRFRTSDVDRLGHVNNAAYWVPLDELWQRGRVRATLEYRQPIDVEEAVVLIVEGARVWLVVADEVRAAARYDEIP